MKKGFTLIELLTVIAIIAILTGILFPVISSVKAKANQSVCATNLMEIGLAISMYCQDNNQRMLPCVSFANLQKYNEDWAADQILSNYSFGGIPMNDCYCWSSVIYPYVNNKNTFDCPSSLFEKDELINGVPSSTYQTGYAININVTGGSVKNLIVNNGKITGLRPPLLKEIKNPHNTILIADGSICGLFGTLINKYMTNDACYIPGAYKDTADALNNGINESYAPDAVERHGSSCVVLYADNHTDIIKGVDLHNEVVNETSAVTGGL